MQIILAILVGTIVYILTLMFISQDTGEKKLIASRLEQISKMGDVLGEQKKIKNNPLIVKIIKSFIYKMISYISTVFPINQKERKKMEKLIIQGGLQMNPEEYISIQIIIILFGGLIGIVLGVLAKINVLYGFAFGLLGGYSIFRFYIKKQVSERQKSIRRQLPEIVDLLTLCVEAGLSFNQAMQYILQKNKGPLINEFEIALKRMNLGDSRREALETMAEHCGIEEMTIFTSSVVQAEELGLPLKDVLVTQSRQARTVRRMKIEEEAQKLAVKILFPLVFLIMPTLFIVILGPALPRMITLMDSM